MSRPSQFALRFALAAASGLGGCHLPTPLRGLADERLARVHEVYARSVETMLGSTEEDWYNGWMGNIWCNTWGGNRRGLCYEWQARTYEAIREVAPAEGFDAVGIMRDRDRAGEHHGVLLYAHATTTGPQLLEAPPPRPAWVLDPWRYGRADVFTLDEWLGAAWSWEGRIEFEDLEAEFQARQAPASPADTPPDLPPP